MTIMQTGRVFGNRYKIIRLLGKGGFGEVWYAHDRELDRYVALKVITPEKIPPIQKFQESLLDKFVKEATTLAKLEHRCIIRAYDFGIEKLKRRKVAYLVMMYATGGTLSKVLEKSRRLKKGVLSLEECKQIILQVCEAIDYAHSQGVVHCDLKPSNIVFDNQGYILIADFGLSRILDEVTHLRISQTEGTEGYMSPEQRIGKNVTKQSDIYALGVIIHEMLLGKSPDERLNWKTVEIHLSKDLPLHIHPIIKRATESAYKERFDTAKKLAKHFEDALEKIYLEHSNELEDLLEKEKNVQVWHKINDGMTLQDQYGHNEHVYCVTFSSSGYLLVSGSEDGTARIWGATGVRKILVLENKSPVKRLTLSSDEELLATGGEEGLIRLWSINNGRELNKFRFHDDTITGLIFGVNNQTLISGSYDRTIKCLSMEYGEELWGYSKHDSKIECMEFSYEHEVLAIGYRDGTLVFVNMQKVNEISTKKFKRKMRSKFKQKLSKELDELIREKIKEVLEEILREREEVIKELVRDGKNSEIDEVKKNFEKIIEDDFEEKEGAEKIVEELLKERQEKEFEDLIEILLQEVQGEVLGEVFKHLQVSERKISNLKLHPSDNMLIFADFSQIYTLDTKNWEIGCLDWCTSEDDEDAVLDLAFNSDGQLLISSYQSGKIVISDIESKKIIWQLSMVNIQETRSERVSVDIVKFHPKHPFFAFSEASSTIRLWKLPEALFETYYGGMFHA